MSILDFGEALASRAVKYWAKDVASDTSISASAVKEVTTNSAKYQITVDVSNEDDLEAKQILASISKDLTSTKAQEQLLELRGSPSFVDMVSTMLLDILKGRYKEQRSKTPKVLLTRIKATEMGQLKRSALGQELEHTKAYSPTKMNQLRDLKGRFFSLASLQVLLNQQLQHVISANMGNQPYPGGQRQILNYRTGRFASTVSVDRLVQSREGMITAFYSYMKYPYQTFEPGYAQGSPRTRDPKLLIAKSIREIAATKVANRMRSVST